MGKLLENTQTTSNDVNIESLDFMNHVCYCKNVDTFSLNNLV